MLSMNDLDLTDEEFFDALDDFAGHFNGGYYDDMPEDYRKWVESYKPTKKQVKKEVDLAKARAIAKAEIMAFYTPENIAAERSPFEE